MEIPRIGQSFPRQDAFKKVTGQEKYAVDFYGDRLIWAGVKRAGVPHARIKRMEVGPAIHLPGVIHVLTHKDVAGSNRQGIIRKDQPVLVDDKVRHCGDALALVLAEDKTVLKKALDLITVDWEILPGVFDMDEALREGAPVIHEDHSTGNILLKGEIVKGQGEAGLKDCEVFVEGTFEFPSQEHAYLETEAGTAVLTGEGTLEIVASTQTPFRDRMEVAEAVGVDPEKIRVIAPYCGGAFGGKDGISVQSLLALAALHCPGRTVKMWWDREESFLASPKRHPARLTYRLGAGTDGTFQALDGRIFFDTGPYDHLGGAVMALGLEHAGGPYRIPHVSLKSWVVYTNNPIGGAFRGFGVPQVLGAMEQMVDLMAEKVGLSPLEIRLRNVLRAGDTNPIGVTLSTSIGQEECLQTVEKHPLWAKREQWKSTAPLYKRRGIGLASAMHGMGYGPIIPDWGRAKIELTPEGKFRLFSGVVDMGQGNAATCLQIAGTLLNQEARCFELVLPDTDRTLPSGSASASRTTFTFGKALIGAAEVLKKKLLSQAAVCLKIERPDELHLVPGEILHESSGRSISLSDLARTLDDPQRMVIEEFQAPICLDEPTQDPNLKLHGLPHLIFSSNTNLVYVEIDELTGLMEIKKYLLVTDCGRVINPQVYEQQMQGGVAQGLGYALYEDYKVEQGRSQTRNLSTYIIPTAVDLPDMETPAMEIPEPSGPFGLKGAGEIPIDGVLPAIANAVADALGKRIFQAPMTAERILKTLNKNR